MKEIKILEEQIDKLNKKDFDLEAWKQYTIVLLARIFGDNNQKIRQIEKIEYDYSSWSLRDTSGSSEYLETCKKLGREILQASIDELKTFGLPDKTVIADDSISIQVIISALENELRISQYRELKDLVKKEMDLDEKKKLLKEKLEKFGKLDYFNIVIEILSHTDLQGKL
jgi:hypothetical protein